MLAKGELLPFDTVIATTVREVQVVSTLITYEARDVTVVYAATHSDSISYLRVGRLVLCNELANFLAVYT